MKPEAAKRLRLLASTVSVILLVALILGAWFFWRIRSSLPQLEGTVTVNGLGAAVTVERDDLGVPTIRGATRDDVSRALGWVHAQERFFQMDVLRRAPAGELAEVFGKRGLPRDRATRMHGFRKLAQTVLARLPADQRRILEAYTAGVNAGLSALRERPFEYLVLRERPQPWRPEDSILVVYAMTLDLQDEDGIYERTLMSIRDHYGVDALAFFAPTMTPMDAALDGTSAPPAPVPSSKVMNLRLEKLGAVDPTSALGGDADALFPRESRDPEAVLGSNAFALGGLHTASGAGMLANDMHLDHAVPNIWYRASLDYQAGPVGSEPSRVKVTGVTLPGAPAIVAGSNGRVAWGFTSSYVDTVDLVVVETNSIAETLYKIPGQEEFTKFEQRRETIRVKGEESAVVDYPWTVWGPIVGTNDRQRPLALRWVAHDPDATNFGLVQMETASTVAEALPIAHRMGIPAQNMLLADRAGAVAWTIAGRMPKRVGYDGRLPVTWTFGDRKWDGHLQPDEVPVMHGEQSAERGRLWSANQRHVGGEALAKMGDGAYRRAPRAAQIRDGLKGLTGAKPVDLLNVLLDDRALFLEPWHKLMMDTLTPEVTAPSKARAALRRFGEKWEGHASIDAVSYRLVREFRIAVHGRVFNPIFARCLETFPRFDARELQLESAVWTLLKEKPIHMLNARFANWDELLVAAADDVIRVVDKQGVRLPQGNWGSRNKARIRHPFSNLIPLLSGWLNMPDDPLPGDVDMPRVQSPTHGASERLVVSPGREEEGIFHMPGGQSGHPMSPFFRAGHQAWVKGQATPFLPGATRYTLTLRP